MSAHIVHDQHSGPPTRAQGLVVPRHDQLGAGLLRQPVAVLDHLGELERRVHVHQRKRQPPGRKRLARDVQHDRRVLADGKQHHRVFTLGDDLAHDVNALGFELLKMREGGVSCPFATFHRRVLPHCSGSRRGFLRPYIGPSGAHKKTAGTLAGYAV
jgi:hypothetical protein